jgi:UDP-N-acetylglucosamine--dolichyl-phosphate N-acetylglucosaminephosphotransferase
MMWLIFLIFAISFIGTLFALPLWILRAKRAGLAGRDMHKPSHEEIAEAGGIVVLIGFLFAVFVYLALQTFYLQKQENFIAIFAILTSLLLIAIIGFLDDILGWKIGLNKKTRILLVLFASIPLIVINVGEATIELPFLGQMNLGLLYPLLLVPVGILGASVTYNFLAGYNGLEAGQGILILSALAFVASKTGSLWLAILDGAMIAALLAFYLYNKYPARIFPGNVLTYSIGAMIAITAILGNMERIALFFFIPYIFEVGLKLRGGLKKESFGKLNPDGTLEVPYEKFYGLEHVAIYIIKKIKGKVYEWEVSWLIHGFQIIIILVGFIFFHKVLFSY